ncbi:ImmA/IrrE family metallo-endopeptidase [Acinetobacter baumannii]|uniref:ImmA/IrrE family metallo-endopeptidase n=1 Tax=Acinetobacter baumannii TaxID=470 RepID=UPI00244B9E1F|nr:ImmA/IrrE family metallo-endopeptidase [Acinetobacter baumannii]MDH2505915.1 ImmA/IrrE family metallo-endopeptidase [Acinetobacter baumannii]MDH2516357.1 ImmA/IrrE family metallo-endopeptidase [Acinetobacter baumannii]
MQLSKEWYVLTQDQRQLIEAYQKDVPMKLGALAKQLGIVVYSATLPSNISGEIKETDGITIIKINRHDTKQRQRFTLAHEIAHFLLHKHLLSNGIVDDVLYRSSQSNAIEAEANRLAADILMPPALVNGIFKNCSHLSDKEKKLEEVAQQLNVSLTALKIRMGLIK